MSDERKPLWTDDEIIEQYKTAFGHSPDVHHMAFACWMRDQYEAALAERDERIVALEQMLTNVLDVAIARGVQLGYEDEDYRAMYHAATGTEWSDDDE